MKRKLIITLSLIVSLCSAQQDIYKKVSAFIKQNNPDLIIQSKLLVINFDNAKDNKTAYVSLDKTAKTYSEAKLKGGRNGVICIAIVEDAQAEISLNKQGYKDLQIINRSQLGNIETSGIENITFNSSGEVVFQNLESAKIYEAINQLITR
jgi:hypothetical protein